MARLARRLHAFLFRRRKPLPSALRRSLRRCERRVQHQFDSFVSKSLDTAERERRAAVAVASLAEYCRDELEPWAVDLHAGGLVLAVAEWRHAEIARWASLRDPDFTRLRQWAEAAWAGR